MAVEIVELVLTLKRENMNWTKPLARQEQRHDDGQRLTGCPWVVAS